MFFSCLEGNDNHSIWNNKSNERAMMGSSGGEVGYLEYIYRKPKYLLAFLFTMWSLSNRASGVSSQGTVFGSYMNYAFFGSEYKSDWMERGWSGELFVIAA